MRNYDADRRLNTMCAGADAIQMHQGSNHADRSVTTHPEVRNTVEEDHAGDARVIDRRAQQRAHDCVRATRFVDDGTTKLVVFISKAFETIRERVVTEIGRATDYDTRGLATGM
jgi:hypothetical protein